MFTLRNFSEVGALHITYFGLRVNRLTSASLFAILLAGGSMIKIRVPRFQPPWWYRRAMVKFFDPRNADTVLLGIIAFTVFVLTLVAAWSAPVR